jgi:tetratricopeptide (TPR) repeat protein
MSNKQPENTIDNTKKRVTALLRKCSTLVRRGDMQKALLTAKEAVRLSPMDARCYRSLAGVYKAQKKILLALAAMKRSVELDPKCSNTLEQLLRSLLELGRYEEAIEIAKRGLKCSPKSMFLRDILGIAYLQRGELDRALEVVNEMVMLAPTDPNNHFKRAVLLQETGQISSAMAAFMRSLEIDPSGEMADDARQAIAALDSHQLNQILALALEDAVFRAKLAIDPESAARERGFTLSANGVSAIRHIDLDALRGGIQHHYYH